MRRELAALGTAALFHAALWRAGPVEVDAPGSLELFPDGALRKIVGKPPAAPARVEHRAWADRGGPSERLSRWAAEAQAEARTRAGLVAPAWREVERGLLRSFHPPVDAVHDVPSGRGQRLADGLRTLVQQQWKVVTRGPDGIRHPNVPGSHTVDTPSSRSIDPSQQGYFGDMESRNMSSLPTQQSMAAVDAWADPAETFHVEVEVETDAHGEIVSARVVVPSGRGALDRYALETVRARVTGAVPEASVSRWVLEASYSVAPIGPMTLHFDENAIFDRRARTRPRLDKPLEGRVQAHVSLRWVLPLR